LRESAGLKQGNEVAYVSTISKLQMRGFAEAPQVKPAASSEAAKPNVLRQAGFTTQRWADSKAPGLIQTALEQSQILRPYISAKLGKISIAKNYHQYSSDPEFVSAYLRVNKIVVPFGPQEKALTNNIRAFYHRQTDSIYVRPNTHFGHVLQMAILKFSLPAFSGFFGEGMAGGVSLYFSNAVLEEQGLEPMNPAELREQLKCATDLVGVAGVNLAGKAFVQDHADLIRHLTTKLSIGPVRPDELTRDALCKTTLLRTARFASHQARNMVAVGMTGPGWVRLWMRSEVSGPLELQISGPRGSTTTKVTIDGGPGDKTLAVTYPRPGEHPALDPATKYRFRIVRTADGQPLGEGSFETSPARDSDTPSKVVIALLSCHQPFGDRGTMLPESERMLRLLPGILHENNVKFVLPCGDQIYADDPGVFSVFSNSYLIRQAVPAKTNIFQCSAEDVRRVYDLRYRTFWSMPAIQKMYANYPCYPAMDDHEIRGDWGSLPEHSGPNYVNVRSGALSAYLDYQASSVLPPNTPPTSSFHYDFSYGNIGVFVMDIRSKRYVANSRSQLYSPRQFDDLTKFLQNNGNKKVLFIVSSVPVVHLGRLLTEAGIKYINPAIGVFGKDIDFPDHWSAPANLPERDRFLSLLHAHQQAHPKQRIAILSGDVHIGNAFGIHWQGGNKPRLYQFTSSPLTAMFRGIEADITTLGPRLLSSIDCKSTPAGGACSARVGLLPGVSGASSRNPFIGMNIGLIEVQQQGDVSNLKFKLIGFHPKEDRPVTYFETGWLG
jgi:alkaline phosphatase D